MKSTLIYSLMVLCCAQPALAQQIESDEQWQQEAARQMQMQNAGRAKQPPKKINQQFQQATKRPKMGGYPVPAHHSSYGGYGYRPSRGSVHSGYGWRPQRAQLMPQGYSQEMLQQKMMRLQQMQGQLGGGAGGGQQQGKPNILQMLMGGGGQAPAEQQGQAGQAQGGRGELLKSLFGGGGGEGSEEGGQ